VVILCLYRKIATLIGFTSTALNDVDPEFAEAQINRTELVV